MEIRYALCVIEWHLGVAANQALGREIQFATFGVFFRPSCSVLRLAGWARLVAWLVCSLSEYRCITPLSTTTPPPTHFIKNSKHVGLARVYVVRTRARCGISTDAISLRPSTLALIFDIAFDALGHLIISALHTHCWIDSLTSMHTTTT